MADAAISSLLSQNAVSPSGPPKKDEPRFLSFENVLDRKDKETDEEKAAGIHLLRTYQSDLAEALKSGGGQSLLSIALAENRRKSEERQQAPATPQEVKPNLAASAQTLQKATAEILHVNEPPTAGKEIPVVAKQTVSATATVAAPLPHISPVSTPTPSTYLGTMEEPRESHTLRWLLLGTLTLLLLGGGALGFVFYKKREVALTPSPSAPLLISSYQEKVVLPELNSATFQKAVQKIKMDQRYALGTIVAVVPVLPKTEVRGDTKVEKEELVDTYTLLSKLLNTRASAALLRSFDPDFTFAFYERPLGAEGFLILKSNYYESSYAEMLNWEPFMRADIQNILLEEKPTTAVAAAGTSTVFTETPDKFQDLVVKNRDVRVLKDKEGAITMVYGFLNRQTLIIARSVETFNEVIGRLTANVRTK